MAAAGTPVSRSARSSVYFSTCALYASNPLVAWRINFSFASPAAIISRPTALASEMSEPTSKPSHRFAHCAELVRRGSTT